MSSYDIRCRICLQDGATHPIFDKMDSFEQVIQSKILICLHVTVEDTEGYPHEICKKCNETLDVFCNFISKFKESCETLENRLLCRVLGLKKNNDTNSKHGFDYDLGIIDNKEEFVDIKDLDAKQTSLKTRQVNVKKNEKKEKNLVKKVLPKKQITKVKINYRTIASSILEAEFSWSGEEWCLNTNKTSSTPTQQTEKKSQEVMKISIPKQKVSHPPQLCDLCGEIFEKDILFLHKQRIHFSKPVTCSICSRVYCSKYYLKRHMKRRHENNKNFLCNACDKRFAYMGELRSHNKFVHEKIRKPKKIFTCRICNKPYKWFQSLVIHERSAHTGERPAVCSVCKISFYHEVYLTEHMRIHTGETPFKCPVCTRGFSQHGNMKSHLRSHRKSNLDATTLSKIKPVHLNILKA